MDTSLYNHNRNRLASEMLSVFLRDLTSKLSLKDLICPNCVAQEKTGRLEPLDGAVGTLFCRTCMFEISLNASCENVGTLPLPEGVAEEQAPSAFLVVFKDAFSKRAARNHCLDIHLPTTELKMYKLSCSCGSAFVEPFGERPINEVRADMLTWTEKHLEALQ